MSDDFSVTGEPEYLEQGGGAPLSPEPAGSGRRLKPVLVGVIAVGGLALAGVGAWAAIALSGGGPQPAEALPESTLGYLSLDLDPSAGQKLEALDMLNKFPAFEDELGLDAQDDLRRELYDWLQDDEGCAHLDYDADIAPWLGDRAAVAAVDLGGDTPEPVFVVQSKDDAAAEQGVAKIQNCAINGDADNDSGVTDTETGWVVSDGWLLAGTDQQAVETIADQAGAGTLADDATYQKWVEEVGDPGIMTVYLAPAAGPAMLELLDEVAPGRVDSAVSTAVGTSAEEPRQALADFPGAAAVVRFNDGSLEIEVAGDAGEGTSGLLAPGRGGDLVGSLPEDTAAAFGLGLTPGWFTDVVERLSAAGGEDLDVEDLLDELSRSTGLDFPEDAETLLGEAAAVSVGADLDLDAIAGSTDGSELPVGLTVQGDPEAIEQVLDKVRVQLPPDARTLVGSDAAGDRVAIGPSQEYRELLLADGSLGESSTFRDVVGEADRASMVLYVNFDAGDGWLVENTQDDPELADNLAPLSAFGVSVWVEGDVSHAVLRLTTD